MVLKLCFALFLISCTQKVRFDAESAKSHRILTDQKGRQVKIFGDIDRIVTAYGPATSFVFQLGLHDKIVGKHFNRNVFQVFLKITDQFSGLDSPGKGKSLNIESVASLRPDVVILFPSKEGLHYAKILESLNIPSFIIDPESGFKIEQTLSSLGELFEITDRASLLTDKINNLLDMVGSNYVKTKKKVYFASSSDFYATYSDQLLQGHMIKLANCENVARGIKGGQINVSLEQLLNWDPDLIVFSSGTLYGFEKKINDERLKKIKAVSQKRVFKMPSNIEPFDYPSATYVLGVLWLAKKAYPEIYTFNLTDIFNEFYLFLYGRTFEELGGSLE